VPEEYPQVRGEQVEPGEDVQEVELEEGCAGEDIAARLPGGQRFAEPPSAVRQVHQRPRDQRDADARQPAPVELARRLGAARVEE
jgi:hypothetical protein